MTLHKKYFATVTAKVPHKDHELPLLDKQLKAIGAFDISVRSGNGNGGAIQSYFPASSAAPMGPPTQAEDPYKVAESIFRNPRALPENQKAEPDGVVVERARRVGKAPELGLGWQGESNSQNPKPESLREIGERTHLAHEICDAVMDLIEGSGSMVGHGVEAGMRAVVQDLLSKYSVRSLPLSLEIYGRVAPSQAEVYRAGAVAAWAASESELPKFVSNAELLKSAGREPIGPHPRSDRGAA